MNPKDAIDLLLAVPYVPGAGNWGGSDCWGVVELWYRHVLGVELDDRAGFPAGMKSVQAAVDTTTAWRSIEAPQDHCLVLMRAGQISYGHVGVFYDRHVLHSGEQHGCVYQPISHRAIQSMTTGYLVRS